MKGAFLQMASLMENLIQILEEENKEYQLLVDLSNKKTPAIIKGDLDNLNKITDKEQVVVNRIVNHEKNRETALKDIAEVINKDVNDLKLADIVQMLSSRPAEQQKLASVHDDLQQTLKNMVAINEHNKLLLNNALEMVEFDMNILQSLKTIPQTANDNKSAYNSGSFAAQPLGGFDTKQ